jgi:hypothetical protein
MEISAPTWLQVEDVLFGLAFGLACALPFIGVKLYAARVSLSVIVAMLANWGLVKLFRSHGWYLGYRNIYLILSNIMGALFCGPLEYSVVVHS